MKHLFEYILIALLVGGPQAPIEVGAVSAVEARSRLPQVSLANQTRAPVREPARLPIIGDRYEWPKLIDTDTNGMIVSAHAAIVVDQKSGKTLFAKNADEARPLASITKLMSALIFLETGFDDAALLEITAEDRGTGEGAVFKVGDTVSARDLFVASLVSSANDAVRALRRATGLTEEAFVVRMNERAREWGMVGAHFVETTGLDSANRATARDVVSLLRAAYAQPRIRETTRIARTSVMVSTVQKNIKSTNVLLDSFLNEEPYGIAIGKTGSLDAAGFCLGVLVERDDHGVYAVVLGSADHFSRFSDIKALVHWAFTKWQWKF